MAENVLPDVAVTRAEKVKGQDYLGRLDYFPRVSYTGWVTREVTQC